MVVEALEEAEVGAEVLAVTEVETEVVVEALVVAEVGVEVLVNVVLVTEMVTVEAAAVEVVEEAEALEIEASETEVEAEVVVADLKVHVVVDEVAAAVVAAAVEDSKEAKKVFIEPHARIAGVFVARGKEDALVTKNLVPGNAVYGEKRISAEEAGGKVEYRIWNPFRSKLGAAILGGVADIFMPPGSKVLYLGAASGTTVSHVSDILGPEGKCYAVEFSHRSGRDLLTVAQKRGNIVPIIEDARHPQKYRMVMSMCDCIFSDVAQPDQARIVALNAHNYLKPGGYVVISIKANCIDSTAPAEAVFADTVKQLQAENIKPVEQVTLEPYEKDHAVVVGIYRPQN